MYLYNVALDISLHAVFTYAYADPDLEVGQRVEIPFGTRKVAGFIVDKSINPKDLTFDITKLRYITQVFSQKISSDIIDLVKFASNYYHYPLGATLFTAVPSAYKKLFELPLPKSPNDYALTQLARDGIQLESMCGIVTSVPSPLSKISLNLEQAQVVEDLTKQFGKYYPAILYGITGSGKTEVYLELIYATLIKDSQNQVLVLVPEINLTPQLLSRFKHRFPNLNIVTLNSHCSPKQRVDNYIQAEQGLVSVVIGTRLSVFTPFKQLSLIIVDEEHDLSFKQQEGLRYNARDLAVFRSNYLKVPIVLGSATPSLESLYNLKCGKYFLYKLTKRAKLGANLPKFSLVDLRHQKQQIKSGLSIQVINSIQQKLALNEVVLVFINRRGYSPQIACYACGWVERCNNCSSNLVLHKKDKVVKCHHCGYSAKIPNSCYKCGSTMLSALGMGTQKIEQALQKLFADKVIERIDQDSVAHKNYWDTLAQKIKSHEIDIIVGTQMLAKGHDFPQITLVVILEADSGLFSYDFRAPEHVFSQIMQVSGRAGRGEQAGQVLLQTYRPTHEIYRYLVDNDFSGFANYLLEKRLQFNLPPVTSYVVFRASGKKLIKVVEYLDKIYKVLLNFKDQLQPNQIIIYAPVPCVMLRLKNKERGQILLAGNDRNNLHMFLNKVVNYISTQIKSSSISWVLDVDPTEIY